MTLISWLISIIQVSSSRPACERLHNWWNNGLTDCVREYKSQLQIGCLCRISNIWPAKGDLIADRCSWQHQISGGLSSGTYSACTLLRYWRLTDYNCYASIAANHVFHRYVVQYKCCISEQLAKQTHWYQHSSLPCQVAHFFFCPCSDHLTWIVPGISMPEPIFSSNILVPIFEQ